MWAVADSGKGFMQGVKTGQQASELLKSQDVRSSDLVPGHYEGPSFCYRQNA